MSVTVWLGANTLYYPEGGGYFWTYLNWAAGLRAAGCRVVWLEAVDPTVPEGELRRLVSALQDRLERYGFAEALALAPSEGQDLPADLGGQIEIDAAREADLLLNLAYEAHAASLPFFRRTALIDIDPGLTQVWAAEGRTAIPPHDAFFTIGETVGRPDAQFPSGGIAWNYAPPCVALYEWPVCPAPQGATFTTVSHWATSKEWFTFGDESFHNDKQSGFLPFLDLPKHVHAPLELALCLAADEQLRLPPWQEEEKAALEERGWRVLHSYTVTSTPWDYQRYVQQSLGEFSCAKPSCIRLQNAWVSDRTLCYLASGKPVVIQHTGPSRFLPDAEGMFRFRTLEEAARHLETALADYERQCILARALAEEHFDARKVAHSVLERALP